MRLYRVVKDCNTSYLPIIGATKLRRLEKRRHCLIGRWIPHLRAPLSVRLRSIVMVWTPVRPKNLLHCLRVQTTTLTSNPSDCLTDRTQPDSDVRVDLENFAIPKRVWRSSEGSRQPSEYGDWSQWFYVRQVTAHLEEYSIWFSWGLLFNALWWSL